MTNNRETKGENQSKETEIELAHRLYGFLPKSKNQLREIRGLGKKYWRDARWGRPEAKQELGPYRTELKILVWAVRMKLGSVLCEPNQNNWDKQAYGFFMALQNNLGKVNRTYFLTLSFPDIECRGGVRPPTYKEVRHHLQGIKKYLLPCQGFENVTVISIHTKGEQIGRLHVHLIVWSRCERTLACDNAALRRVESELKKGRYGVGRMAFDRVRNFISVAAYFAWNYDCVLKVERGGLNPIPKSAHVLSPPREVRGKSWEKTGKFSFVDSRAVAWRAAISRYAEATGRSSKGDLRWIWINRREIRNYLQPEEYRIPSFVGFDGYTYTVKPYELDHEGSETYLVSSDLRGGFVLTEHGLETVARFDVMNNALQKMLT